MEEVSKLGVAKQHTQTYLKIPVKMKLQKVIDMKHIPLKMVKRLSIIFSILGLLFILIGCCIGSMSTMAV